MKKQLLLIVLHCFLCSTSWVLSGQNAKIIGKVTENGIPLPSVNLSLIGTPYGTATDFEGNFWMRNLPQGNYVLKATAIGYSPYSIKISLNTDEKKTISIALKTNYEQLEESVVTGTLKAVNRLESPVPVEVYSPTFLKKNPTANIFEALQNINGVRPQINCNVCNTGDIHINGLEGPYTLVLIDGMPIVSGLGTVYGLSGIPNSLISQIEIVKGPASSLYGSEAVGG
ncbi:MAG: TonB-dependent receptor, partial [Flavobacteriaceae bacterium]